MSVIRTLSLSTALAAMMLGAVPAQAAAPGRRATTPAASPAEAAKRAVCEKVWAAQKVRHGARQAFVAACVAKG